MGVRSRVGGAVVVGVAVVAAGAMACERGGPPPPAATSASPPPAPSASAPSAHGTVRLTVAPEGTATFLIDAPLEAIKGRWTKLRGAIDLDPSDLTKSHGEIDLDLGDLHTETFGDPKKDEAQTEHARNWLDIGTDAAGREANRWARFTFTSLDSAAPAKLPEAAGPDGLRTVKVVAKGDLWLHGVTSPKTVKLTVAVSGPASAPTAVRITSDEPLRVSLKEHDVKPRDIAGKFLAGALERVGKKIDDAAQVSLDLTAKKM